MVGRVVSLVEFPTRRSNSDCEVECFGRIRSDCNDHESKRMIVKETFQQ
jgi:hypothetical protein